MGVRLVQLETVVAGKFNPHVITPAWLVKEGLAPEGSPSTAKAAMRIEDRGVAFRYTLGDYSWEVDFNRLAITCEKSGDPSLIAAKVAAKLPHTPLIAVGNNFTFDCRHEDWRGKSPQIGNLAPEALQEFGDLQDVVWSAAWKRASDLTVNVRLAVEIPNAHVTVTFNYHRTAHDATAVQRAAGEFALDLANSREMLKSLFDVETAP